MSPTRQPSQGSHSGGPVRPHATGHPAGAEPGGAAGSGGAAGPGGGAGSGGGAGAGGKAGSRGGGAGAGGEAGSLVGTAEGRRPGGSLAPATVPGAALVLSVDLGRGGGFGPHVHAVHQLAWSARGALSVTVEGDTWVLPPARALWIPAGFRHEIDATHGAAMRSPYFDPAACPVAFEHPTVVGVGGLLRELIAHLADKSVPDDARGRAEAVIFDLLTPVPATAIRLLLPADPRARTVATALLADPADQRSLDAWAQTAAASPRTLARLFTSETGLGFRQWRTLLRIREALPLLAAGLPVSAVAHRVGYETPSAFVAAFHRELGITPSTFLNTPRPPHPPKRPR